MSRRLVVVALGGLSLLVLIAVLAMLLDDDTGADEPGVLARRTQPERTIPELTPATASDAPARATPLVDARRDVDPDAEGESDAEPVEGRKLAGRVVRAADGSPIADAIVHTGDVTLSGGAVTTDGENGFMIEFTQTRDGESTSELDFGVHAVTDAGGRFDLLDVPTDVDTVLVGALLDGRLVGHRHPLPARTGDLTDLVFVVDNGWIVRGVVLTPHGFPVPGAEVSLGSEPAGDHLASRVVATSDHNGAFELVDVLPVGGRAELELEAVAPGYVRETVKLQLPEQPAVVGPVEIELASGGAIEGYVSLAGVGGRPSQPAQVEVAYRMGARHVGGVPRGLVGHVDEQGFYRIDGVPPGTFLLKAQCGDVTGYRWVPGIEVQVGRSTRCDVALGGGALVGGRVADGFGVPVRGATVRLTPVIRWPTTENTGSISSVRDGHQIKTILRPGVATIVELRAAGGARAGGPTTVTDGRGAYAFAGVNPGTVAVSVEEPSEPALLGASRELQIVGHEQLGSVDFVLGRALLLRGVVRGPDRRPLPDVHVSAKSLASFRDAVRWSYDEGVQTDEDGRFELTGLTDEPFSLWVHKSGFADQRRTVQPTGPGGRSDEFDLALAAVLHGRVVDASTGMPLLAFTVTTRCGDVLSEASYTSADGDFQSEMDDDDIPCTLTVRAKGYREVVLNGIRPSDTRFSPVLVRLRRGP